MIIVLFEVTLKTGKLSHYLHWVEKLTQDLYQIKGFVSVQRFQHLSESNQLLSLSVWENEIAIKAWREHAHHVMAQEIGRAEIFERYSIRIAMVTRTYDFSAES